MLADRVLSFVREHRMVGEGDLILVAVSGGADSLCLAHVLYSHQQELGVRLHVAHLDHGLRPESASEARLVTEMAEEWGLPCTVERQDVRHYRARHRLSLEEAARRVRYGFLGRLSSVLGAAGVAVGHTADDQVETLLLHWVRGTGLAGLRGMQPCTLLKVPEEGVEVRVLRPLLTVRRSETEAYCQAAGLRPTTDPSNASIRYMRNRIRHRLLPAMESYNPRIRDALLRTARVIDCDYTFIEGEVLRVWPDLVSYSGGALRIEADRARTLPPALLYHLLRLAVEKVAGTASGLEMVHLERMAQAFGKPAGTLVILPRGLTMSVGYGDCTLSVGRTPPPLPVLNGTVPLNMPGETLLPGWKVEARIEDSGFSEMGEDPWTAMLDLDKTGSNLSLRPRAAGDRFQPLGMAREKRLQDFFVDAKIPRVWRERVPLVVTPSQIIWVAGWRIDDRVKVTLATRRVLRLEFTLTVGQSPAPQT